MGVRFALPAPDVTVAEWLRRWIVTPTTRVQFSPVTPFAKGVRLVESRQSLKLASGVRFAHPLPLAAGAMGSASDSDSGGSRFEAWAASQIFRGYRSMDRIERYERSDWGSTPHTRTKVSGRSSNRTGRSAPNAEIGVGIPTGRPVLAVVAER